MTLQEFFQSLVNGASDANWGTTQVSFQVGHDAKEGDLLDEIESIDLEGQHLTVELSNSEVMEREMTQLVEREEGAQSLLDTVLHLNNDQILNLVQAAAELPGNTAERFSKAYEEIAGRPVKSESAQR